MTFKLKILTFPRKDTLHPHEPVGWKTTCRRLRLLLSESLTPLNSIAAKFCKAMDSCKYWTWLVDTVGKKCCLKTSDSGLTSLRWPGASGAKSNCCGEDKPEDC